MLRRKLLGILSACFDFLSDSLQCYLWAIQQSFIRFNNLLLFLQKRNNRLEMDECVNLVEKDCLGDLRLSWINVSKISWETMLFDFFVKLPEHGVNVTVSQAIFHDFYSTQFIPNIKKPL